MIEMMQMICDVTHRIGLQDCKIILVRSSKKNEFWDFFSVIVKVFSQFWVRFCSDEKMIADIDILFKIVGLHDRMIAGSLNHLWQSSHFFIL